MNLRTLLLNIADRGASAIDLAGDVLTRGGPPFWTNNAAQVRYSRRSDHHHLRSVWRMPDERDPLVENDDCLCGRPMNDHRHLGYLPPSTMTCTRYRPVPPTLSQWQAWHWRPRMATWVIRYPAWIGWLRGHPNEAARRWVDRHVQPWIRKSDLAQWAARPPYSVEAYVQRYADEAAGRVRYHPVTPGRHVARVQAAGSAR